MNEPAEGNKTISCCHEASVGLFWRQVRLSHQALFKSRPAEGNTSIVFSKAHPRVHPFFGEPQRELPLMEVWDHYLPLVKNCWRSLPLGKSGVSMPTACCWQIPLNAGLGWSRLGV